MISFLDAKIVQVHLTLKCNLSCTHCYTNSGPRRTTKLEENVLLERLQLLYDEGYRIVSFSGGEPLIYPNFFGLAKKVKDIGYHVNLTTNGLSIRSGMLDELRNTISTIAVSIDGPEEINDQIRGAGAFVRANVGIDKLKDADIPFAVSHCVTTLSLSKIPWLVEYCVHIGARSLHIHPIVSQGRGEIRAKKLALSQEQLARLYVMSTMQKLFSADKLHIQLDLLPRVHAVELMNRQKGAWASSKSQADVELLSEIVNPVVISASSELLPLTSGISKTHVIASGTSTDWKEPIRDYKKRKASKLDALFLSVSQRLEADRMSFVDWYSYLAKESKTSQSTVLEAERMASKT